MCCHCRLKAYIVLTFWAENQSFRNKSGKAQPIRTKFDIPGHVKGWQRSGNFGRDTANFGQKWGWDESHRAWVFLCMVIPATFRQLCNGRFLPNLVTKRSLVSRQEIWKDIFENFHFRGHFPPKSEIESWSNRHLNQSRQQITGCREILFTPRCSPRPREFPRSVKFSLRRTVAELRGVGFAQFSDFGVFSPYKTPKTYLLVTSLQPRGYIAEWSQFFRVVEKVQRGAFQQRSFPATYGRRARDPQTCSKFRLWQMAIPVQNSTSQRVRSGPKMSENAQF